MAFDGVARDHFLIDILYILKQFVESYPTGKELVVRFRDNPSEMELVVTFRNIS